MELLVCVCHYRGKVGNAHHFLSFIGRGESQLEMTCECHGLHDCELRSQRIILHDVTGQVVEFACLVPPIHHHHSFRAPDPETNQLLLNEI